MTAVGHVILLDLTRRMVGKRHRNMDQLLVVDVTPTALQAFVLGRIDSKMAVSLADLHRLTGGSRGGLDHNSAMGGWNECAEELHCPIPDQRLFGDGDIEKVNRLPSAQTLGPGLRPVE